jgi:hypothetical protein
MTLKSDAPLLKHKIKMFQGCQYRGTHRHPHSNIRSNTETTSTEGRGQTCDPGRRHRRNRISSERAGNGLGHGVEDAVVALVGPCQL